MSSILVAVFGLLVNKGRDKVVEKLKEGDITDQKLRDLIVREIDDMKSKLDGLARKDLLAAIDYFEEGLVLLSDVVHSRSFQETIGDAKTVSLARRITNLELAGLDDSAKEVLSKSKERFKDARRKATEAFNDESLTISDRVHAMEYRVLATILETVDDPSAGLLACQLCIEKLHALPAVQNSFDVELKKGLRSLFSKDERRKIISTVCRMNRVIYDVKQALNEDLNLWNWPCVSCGEEAVDPLRDSRVVNTMSELCMDFCVGPWSFGNDGEEEHRLKTARGVAINSQGQFITGDNEDGNRNVKVFDSNGNFQKSFRLSTDDSSTTLSIYNVAIDDNDSIYVLVRLMKPGSHSLRIGVYVYDSTASLHHKFLLRNGSWNLLWYALTISESKKVMAVANKAVDVHETNGQFVCSFGHGILRNARDITAASEGHALVVDRADSCVHVFSEQGEHLSDIKVQGSFSAHSIAFHRESDHIVVISHEQGSGKVRALIYTKGGHFVRSIQLGIDCLKLNTSAVTKEGRFAVVYRDLIYQSKILIA